MVCTAGLIALIFRDIGRTRSIGNKSIAFHLEGLQENVEPAPYPISASEFIEALAA
jgi:hypothetical protein